MHNSNQKRVLVLTSNSRRHRQLVTTLAPLCGELLVVCEAQPIATGLVKVQSIGLGPDVAQHFRNIADAERKLFGDQRSFALNARLLPIVLGDVNLQECFNEVKNFDPEIAFVFGSSWIKEPLSTYLDAIESYNIHMGISPHYRGHSTNFWAFCKGEPEYVGGTILGLDRELDGGDVICHVRPELHRDDDYYLYSMRAVEAAIVACAEILQRANSGRRAVRHHMLKPIAERYFTSAEFTNEVARTFLQHHTTWMRKFVSSGQLTKVMNWQVGLEFAD